MTGAGRPPISRRALTAAIGAHPALSMAITLFVLIGSWSQLLPLFAGPDETSNFVKGAAVVRGELVGDGAEPSIEQSYFRTTVDIDRQYGAANYVPWCFAPYPERPACDRPLDTTDPRDERPFTNVGRYPPAAFAITGLGTVAGATDTAVRLGRLLNAVWCSALLAVAFARLRADGTSGAVFLTAVTPGVIFLGAVISPSGPEICGALAVWVLLSAACRGGIGTLLERVGLVAACVTLVVARPIGALLLALILAVVLAAGPGLAGIRILVRRHLGTVITSVAAAALMLTWYARVFSVDLDPSVASGQPSIGTNRAIVRAVGHLPELTQQVVGNFGWLDTPAPTLAVWLTVGSVVAVLVAAAPALDSFERRAVVMLAAITVLLSIYLDLDYYRLLRSFGVQGRHLAPLMLGLPLLVAHRWHPSLRAQWALLGAWLLSGAACAIFALRRYAVGVANDNFLDLFDDAVWTPPLGIWLSLAFVLVALGAVAVVAMGGSLLDRHG